MIYFLLFIPLIIMIGINFIQANLMLKEYQAIFILFSVIIIVLTYTKINDNYITLILPLIIAESVHFIVMGLFGNKLTTLTYKYLLIFMGLIPWVALFTR